ncbi:MAG: hypothetical protein CMP62_02400 [Flavobacteriales bacterium]|nr:hypothetical protein [Flavobacteriales bacterium]|tara:strand:+ start:525 stop:1148 length:624 start_codon:yes stop_codon:yes gene_type:complete
MGIVRIKKEDNYKYALWKIEEKLEDLLLTLNPTEKELFEIQKFRNKKRQKQNIAARLTLNTLGGKQIKLYYTKTGKPKCLGFDNISISHSYEYCIVIVSKYPIGIDIQYKNSNIIKLSSKFINSQEKQGLENINDIEKLHFIWCAKEAIYKTLNNEFCSFKKNIYINPKTNKTETTGLFQKMNKKINYKIYYEKLEDYFISIAKEKI